jgi:hypothetical protein
MMHEDIEKKVRHTSYGILEYKLDPRDDDDDERSRDERKSEREREREKERANR